jgi:hypothetical protein
LLLLVEVMGGPNLADLPTEEIVRQLLRATKTPPRLVVDQFDAVAASLPRHFLAASLPRQVAAESRLYIKLCQYRKMRASWPDAPEPHKR